VERSDISEQRVIEATIQRREGNTWATTIGPWPLLALSAAAIAAAWLIQRKATLRRRQPEQPPS